MMPRQENAGDGPYGEKHVVGSTLTRPNGVVAEVTVRVDRAWRAAQVTRKPFAGHVRGSRFMDETESE